MFTFENTVHIHCCKLNFIRIFICKTFNLGIHDFVIRESPLLFQPKGVLEFLDKIAAEHRRGL